MSCGRRGIDKTTVKKQLKFPFFSRRQTDIDGSPWFRRVLGIFLFLLIYDGSIRKWLLPGAEQLVFIAKDALLVSALFLWLVLRGGKPLARLHPWVRLLFALYAYWVVLRVFSTSLPNLAVGLWGVKSHLLYASVLLFLPLAYPKLEDLFAVLEKIYPWVVVPVCSMAFAQVLAPADSFLNLQLDRGADQTAYFGEAGLVRVTGTFSYIAGMAAFVQCTCLLGMALYLGGARSRLFLVGLGFAMAALPVTGSRGVVAVVMVGAVLMLMGALAGRVIGLRTVVRACAVMVVLVAVSLYVQDTAWQAFAQRVGSNPQDQNRTITAFTNAFEFMDVAGLTGFGTGAANLGARPLSGNIMPFSWLPMGDRFEEESGRIVIELGIIGWALSLGLRVGLVLWAGALVLSGGLRTVRAVGVLALPVMALGVQQGNGVFAVPLWSVYFWFCVALMAMARHQDLQSKAARGQQPKARWQRVIAR